MSIGARIRELRETKGLSQGDIEKSTGLLRCYTSRVENGHTVPSLETLERFASGLGIPLFQLFVAGGEASDTPNLTPRKTLQELAQDARSMVNLELALARAELSEKASIATKGAGMLAPALATMLVVITTDAVVDAAAPAVRGAEGDARRGGDCHRRVTGQGLIIK